MTCKRCVQDAADLGIEHADQLSAPRHLDAEQPLGRQAEGVLLIHRRDVIEPVEIRDRLQIGLVLDQLLGAAMQQADMRIDALDDLAVELQDKAQHAVGRRMLRAEVDVKFGSAGCRPSAISFRVLRFRLLVARQHVVARLPRRQEIEVAEFLRQLTGS